MIITATHLKIAAVGGVLLLASLVAAAYVHQQIEAAKSEAIQKTKDEDIKQYQASFAAQQKTIQSLQDDIVKIKRDQADELAAVRKTFANAQTPQQIADLSTKVMGLQEAIRIITPPATKENPNPEPVAVVPLADAPRAKEYLQQCEECSVNLKAVTRELADTQDQLKAKDAQISAKDQTIGAVAEQRDAAMTAAKGGSWIRRVGRAAKWFAIGAAAGAIAAKAAH